MIYVDKNVELWTARDVAAALKIGERTVWRMVSTSEFPQPIKIGRLSRWRPSTIQDWIGDREAARQG